MKLRPATLLWIGIASLSLLVVSVDPLHDPKSQVSSGRQESELGRVFPELSGREVQQATLELTPAKGSTIRVAPSADGGHQVIVDDLPLGPVSEVVLDNAWSNLRMATVLRSPSLAGDQEIGRWGAIRIQVGDQNMALRLGQPTADSAGVYARRSNNKQAWVVESELATLTEGDPESWLRTSLLHVDVDALQRVQWSGGQAIVRGQDRRWRWYGGTLEGALLSTHALNLRLQRQLQAPIRGYLKRKAELSQSLRPWLTVVEGENAPLHVMAGGSCGRDGEGRLIDRGPGLLGCVEQSAVEPWTFLDPRGYGLLEPTLVPQRYGEWIGARQVLPEKVSLRRRPGRWELATPNDRDRFSVVSEAEVFRWFGRLGELALRPGRLAYETAEQGQDFVPSWQVELSFDGAQSMQIACVKKAQNTLCRRDQGPIFAVQGPPIDAMALSFEALAQRQLLRFSPGSVRSLEVVDRSQLPPLRQSLHLDYGQWRLDAPLHPDGDGGLDRTRLESLLATLGDLRAERWLDRQDAGEVIRSIDLEYVPGLEEVPQHRIRLYAGCALQVDEGRLARVEQKVCDELHADLLFRDPIAFFLRDASAIDIEYLSPKGETLRRASLRVQGELLRDAKSGKSIEPALAQRLRAWANWRIQALRGGTPSDPAKVRLHIRRRKHAAVSLELGEGWLKISGTDWYALVAETSPETADPQAPRGPIAPGG